MCTDEALMAYRLQKQGLPPKQIRQRIIEQFSEQWDRKGTFEHADTPLQCNEQEERQS